MKIVNKSIPEIIYTVELSHSELAALRDMVFAAQKVGEFRITDLDSGRSYEIQDQEYADIYKGIYKAIEAKGISPSVAWQSA